MGILWTILIGFIAGAIAKMVTPGPQKGGFIRTTVLGIAGSFVGSFIVRGLGWGQSVGFIGSVIGAVIIILVARAVNKG